jgi:hypothetical protein
MLGTQAPTRLINISLSEEPKTEPLRISGQLHTDSAEEANIVVEAYSPVRLEEPEISLVLFKGAVGVQPARVSRHSTHAKTGGRALLNS